MKKLSNDATKVVQSLFYQCYIALEKCFDLMDNEKLYIETYGDVTISSKENGTQIEVKDYEKKITDLDHNVWNTLRNWVDDTNIQKYKKLILLTTQELSDSSLFKDWNSNDGNEKLELLTKINIGYQFRPNKSDKTQKLLENVLCKKNEDKLLIVLDKFSIYSSNICDKELYRILLETRTHGVMKEKKEDYINSLMGFIISPKVSSTTTGWEISYESFQKKARSLMEEYTSKTVIFPSTSRMVEINPEEEGEHLKHTFVKKIDEIEYAEVKKSAILDYIYTREIILHELNTYQILKEHYNDYENQIYRSYLAKYNMSSRNTTDQNIINDSKNLYDLVTGEQAPPFRNFNNTPLEFKNGILHQMADDDADNNQKKIVWKLGGKNE